MKLNVAEIASVQDSVVTSLDVVVELAVAALLLVLLVAFHGWGLTYASRKFSRRMARLNKRTSTWRIYRLMTLTVGSLLIIHLIECLVWALPIYALGITVNFKRAFTFVFESYTTLGLTAVAVPEKYDLLPPMIAVTGLFTFGWTGSSLVFVMNQILRLQARQARQSDAEDAYRGPFAA